MASGNRETPARSRSRLLGEGDTKGYRWPADKLTVADMHMLHLISVRTKKPINVLLHEAVELFYEVMNKPLATESATES